MLVEFRDSDRMLGIKAIDMYRKGLEAAKAACDKVYVPTLVILEAESLAEGADSFAAHRLDEMGIGEVRELDIPHPIAQSLRTAVSIYLSNLSKLAEKEGDMLVAQDNTHELMSKLQSLADRLNGQTELEGTVTMTFGDSEPVTMTSRQLHEAAERIGRRKRKTD